MDFGIIIIDTDGAVKKNDTLKSTFPGADRFAQQWSVHTHSLTDVLHAPEFATYYAMQRPTAAACLTCPELRICGGGMPVNRWRADNGYDNPSVYCADQLFLIRHLRHRLPLSLLLLGYEHAPTIVSPSGLYQPFHYLISPEALDLATSRAVLAWLESEAPWQLVEADFYEQFECSLWDVRLPTSARIFARARLFNCRQDSAGRAV